MLAPSLQSSLSPSLNRSHLDSSSLITSAEYTSGETIATSPATPTKDQRHSSAPLAVSDRVAQDIFSQASQWESVPLESMLEEGEIVKSTGMEQVGLSPSPKAGRRIATGAISKALFPPRPLHLVGKKRFSFPATSTASIGGSPSPSRRKSCSPSHKHSRPDSSGSLLAVPLARQMHALKARNAALEAALASAKTDTSSGLYKATTRIQALQQENEGWEAEATRLALEVETAKKEASDQKQKRKAAKDLVVRLRCELVNRKLKEKWELAIMDAEDRKAEATQVELEYDMTMLEYQAGMDRLHREELEEVMQEQATKLEELGASRSLLLRASQQESTQVGTLGAELLQARQDYKKAEKAHASDRAALTMAHASVESTVAELSAQRVRAEALEQKVAQLKEELKALESGEKKEEKREVTDARKALDKERSLRTKADADLHDLKLILKETKAELREALKSANLAIAQAATAMVAAKAVTAKSSAPRKRTVSALADTAIESASDRDASPEMDEDADSASDDAMEAEDERERVPPSKPARTATKVRAKPVARAASTPPPDESQEEVEQDEESYRPIKTKSRSTMSSKAPKEPKSQKKRKDTETASASLTVLGDKSTNPKKAATKEKDSAPERPKASKASPIVLSVESAPPAEKDKTVDAKKKKRKLFGTATKFDWNAIENADVNTLGLPANLSPVKGGGRPAMGGLFGRAGSVRPSIFG